MLFLTINALMSDNIKCIYPEDTENAIAQYMFDVQCTHCRETHSSPVTIDRFERHEMPGSRGEASFVMRCKFCGSDISINLSKFEDCLYNASCTEPDMISKTKELRKKHGLRDLSLDSAALLELDCRGCEVTAFHPGNLTFIAELTSGKSMSFQLEDDSEWYDYDDDSGEEVTVTELRGTIIKGK